MPTKTTLAFAALTAALQAQSPSYQVVPSAFTTTDAMSYEWIAGATDPQRQQTLIGANHLQALVNHQITALEFRRTAVDEDYLPGAADLAVTLSVSPNPPLHCSNQFAQNVGANATLVFQGTVTFPASPRIPTGVGSPMAWTPSNIVRVQFTQPFTYTGGTLCVDVTGTPIQGQKTWWMADAMEDVIPGSSAVQLGGGCGYYGGPNREWSFVAVRSLIPGGYAQFRAEGSPNGLAFALFGAEATAPAFPTYPPLSQWGLPTPGCVCYVNPLLILAVVPTLFEPEAQGSGIGALAEVLVHLPPSASWAGFTLTTQWYDVTLMAVSNGFRWTVGATPSSLDMALCEGNPASPRGNVTTYLAHVLRFEYQ
ncbi:MAG: hypothetical protein U1E73_10055 [Planctomycetota bacterium]